MHLGACIFYKPPMNESDRDKIEEYRGVLEKLCQKQGLTQGIFPQAIAPDIRSTNRVVEDEEEYNPNEVDFDMEIPPVIDDEQGEGHG